MFAFNFFTMTDRRCFNWVIEVVLSLKCRSAYRVESSLNIFLADFPSPPEDSTAKGANSIDESEVRFPKATILRSSARFAATPAVSAAAGSNDDCRGEAIVTSNANVRPVDQLGM